VSKGPAYLVAHACFECRKSYKLKIVEGRIRNCPQCGGSLHEMGRSFRPPGSGNREQWLKVQALYAAGFRFFSHGQWDAPPPPARLNQVKAFIAKYPDHPLRVAAPNRSLEPGK
jgi:hypothetical protein